MTESQSQTLQSLAARAEAGDARVPWRRVALDTARERKHCDAVARLDAHGALQWGLWIGPPGAKAGRAQVHCVGLFGTATLLEYVPGEWVRQSQCPPWFARVARLYLRALGALEPSQLDLLGVARG